MYSLTIYKLKIMSILISIKIMIDIDIDILPNPHLYDLLYSMLYKYLIFIINVYVQVAYLVVTEVFLASWLSENLDQSFSLR